MAAAAATKRWREFAREFKTTLFAPNSRQTACDGHAEEEEEVGRHPYMTSALRGGGGVSPKEDVVREVA